MLGKSHDGLRRTALKSRLAAGRRRKHRSRCGRAPRAAPNAKQQRSGALHSCTGSAMRVVSNGTKTGGRARRSGHGVLPGPARSWRWGGRDLGMLVASDDSIEDQGPLRFWKPNYAWVANRPGLSRRRDTLCHGHHAGIASASPARSHPVRSSFFGARHTSRPPGRGGTEIARHSCSGAVWPSEAFPALLKAAPWQRCPPASRRPGSLPDPGSHALGRAGAMLNVRGRVARVPIRNLSTAGPGA